MNEPPSPGRNLVTIQEFCQHCNVSRRSVFRLLKKGLPSIKAIGVGRRILLKEATQWLLSGGARTK